MKMTQEYTGQGRITLGDLTQISGVARKAGAVPSAVVTVRQFDDQRDGSSWTVIVVWDLTETPPPHYRGAGGRE